MKRIAFLIGSIVLSASATAVLHQQSVGQRNRAARVQTQAEADARELARLETEYETSEQTVGRLRNEQKELPAARLPAGLVDWLASRPRTNVPAALVPQLRAALGLTESSSTN